MNKTMQVAHAASRLRLLPTCCRLLKNQPQQPRMFLLRCGNPYTRAPLVAAAVRCFSDKASTSDGPKQKQSKVKRKEKKAGGKNTESQRSKELSTIMAALDAPERKEPPVSDEEKARRYTIGRNYTIGRFRLHNENEHDLACKIRLKQHAIQMLPRDSKLKEEALKISDEMPPLWRPIPVWTPPIPGFDPSMYIVKDDDKR